MNFIEEINAFERWLETNHLPANSQLLWYKLFMLNNRANWVDWLQVDNLRLMSLIQVESKNTFIRAREKLIEANLIAFKKGKKGCPNKYKLRSLCVYGSKNEPNTEPESAPQTEPNTEPESAPQTGHIYKLNQTNSSAGTGGNARGDHHSEFSLTDAQVSDLRRIGEAYENDIGVIPSSAMHEFQDYYLGHGISADVLVRAIQAAAENNVRTWPYIRTILERCVKEKVITLEDWKQAELHKKSRKAGNGKPSGGQTGGKTFTEIIAERMGT